MTIKRNRLSESTGDNSGGVYFDDVFPVERFSSGCELLNRVLGRGWAKGRIANIVGDKSTGKTLLAIEACANFHREHEGNCDITYNEAEAAFDIAYAQTVGLPAHMVRFPEKQCETVEDFFEDLERVVNKAKRKKPTLYVIDSLDSLSDRAELEREIDKGSFGVAKAKLMSQIFRRLVRKMESKNVTLIVISQVRDKIGVTFGKSTTRSGGRALDFYASQVIWLSNLGKILKTRDGVVRPVGVRIRVKCEKNKTGLPYRECEMPILFSYGIDDVTAAVEWLKEVKRLDAIGVKPSGSIKFLKRINRLPAQEFKKERRRINKVVREVWGWVEEQFKPSRSKY